MTFYQTHTFRESEHGNQSVTFVVTDSYAEILTSTGTQVDVFVTDSTKDDLNTDDGKFAVAAMDFEINEAACNSTESQAALSFCLDAANRLKSRIVALFFGDRTLANLKYIGLIKDAISGEDYTWAPVSFSAEIKPKRKYKFKTVSYDAALLEKCAVNKAIYATDPNDPNNQIAVPNLNDRLIENSYSLIAGLRAPYNCQDIEISEYYDGEPIGSHYETSRFYLVNLYDAINMLLAQCNGILEQTEGAPITFSFTASSLPYKASPADIEAKYDISVIPNASQTATNRAALICPMMIHNGYGTSFESNEAKSFSLMQYTNASEMIFSIARALGCYVQTTTTLTAESVSIAISFATRNAVVESEPIYVLSADKASLEVSSVISSSEQRYYSQGGTASADGYDFHYTSKDGYIIMDTPTKRLKAQAEERAAFEKSKNLKYERLLFSTSKVITQGTIDNGSLTDFYLNEISTANPVKYDYLSTSLYINDGTWTRPVDKLYWNDGSDDYNGTLADLANHYYSTDKLYYQNEYEWEIPFWNGFAKKTDGVITEQNLSVVKLGSVIQVIEERYVYNESTSQWTLTALPAADYVVVGLERSTTEPRTKLKLHSISRFAFGENTEPPVPSEGESTSGTYTQEGGEVTTDYESDASASFLAGDAVMINDAGALVKAQPTAENYGRYLGIALESVNGIAKPVRVQLNGIVKSLRYSFTPFKAVTVKATIDDSMNLSDTFDWDANGLRIEVGTAASFNAINLNRDEALT